MPDMETRFTLAEIADHIGGVIEGDPTCQVTHIASLSEASAHAISFIAHARYCEQLANTQAAAIVISPLLADQYTGNKLLVDDPYWGFAKMTELFKPATTAKPQIHPTAVIDDHCQIGDGVSIGPHVTIGCNVELGDNVSIGAGCYIGDRTIVGNGCQLYPHVTLYHDTVLGKFGIIHAGVVIGADGFGFAPNADGWQKIHQLGAVTIGDNVELGAGTTIDRGALGNTVIGNGVKIDNQVQVAHNVHIGEHTAIAACSAIAGSTIIGAHCTIAGAVGIVGHLEITDHVHITAMTLVTKSIRRAGSYSSGVPMGPTKQWRRNAARFNQLDQIATRLRQHLQPGEE